MRKYSFGVLIAALILGLLPAINTSAQGDNLLQNPGLENPYVGQGAADQTAPAGWSFYASIPGVTSFPHIDPSQIHGGAAAWNIRKGGAPFAGGGYQQVPGIQVGSIVRGNFYGSSYTCNDAVHSCISNGQRHSDTSSGAVFKVGIDPSGGTDVNSSQIVWSAPVSSFDSFGSFSIDATACNTTVTLFMYTTQSTGMFINSAYFDDASLRVLQPGAGGTVTCGQAPGGPGATAAPPTQAFAPFVKKQEGNVQPDGSILHTVVAGDTLAAIAVAYGLTLDEIRALNNFGPGEGSILQIGQQIIVRGPTPMTATSDAPPTIQSPFTPLPFATVTPTVTGNGPIYIIVTATPVAVAANATGAAPSGGISLGNLSAIDVVTGFLETLIRIWLSQTAAGG